MKAEDGTPKFTAEQVDELIALKNRLPNLELLPGLENIGKSDKAPDDWLAAEYPSEDERSAFLARNALPATLPHSVDDFMAFYDLRMENLTARIKDKLKTQAPEPVASSEDLSEVALDEALTEGDDEV